MNKFIIILFQVIICSAPIYSQIGVNTETPTATLDVVSSTVSTIGQAFVSSTSDNKETMLIRNDGYIGVGNTNPLVKLDLRSADASEESTIGIGYTSLSASDAGAGAIRYDPTLKIFQYSNGVEWVTLLQNTVEKALVIAQNYSKQKFTTNETVASGPIRNWTVAYDNDVAEFESVSGEFKALRDGVYSVAISAVLEADSMDVGGQYEIQISPLEGENNSFKSVTPILSDVEPILLTNFNKALVRLKAGESVRIIIYIRDVKDPKLVADGSLTTLIITEM